MVDIFYVLATFFFLSDEITKIDFLKNLFTVHFNSFTKMFGSVLLILGNIFENGEK